MSYRPEAHWLEKNNRWQLNAHNEADAKNTLHLTHLAESVNEYVRIRRMIGSN